MGHTVREHQGVIVVALEGDIDLDHSPEVRELLLAQVAKGHDVLVDLSGVAYIDSSGIASLIEGLQSARRGSLRFELVALSDQAMRVLKLARLDKVFTIHDTLESAMAVVA